MELSIVPFTMYSAHVVPEHRFHTTRWSLVVAAGGDRSTVARQALATLCEIYWYPLYVYIRRQGHGADSAQDLTQAFFIELLERHDVQRLRRDRGRLRSYLLAAVRHFLLNESARSQALKRGGGQALIALEFDAAEGRYVQEPADIATPQRLFERRWALTVLDHVFRDLRQEWESLGKGVEFDVLKDCLVGEPPAGGYETVAKTLGTTANAVGVAVHRLRRAFRLRLREVIADTVVDEDAIDDEIRHLFASLGT
jgi:RNA polymerase sigma-70 factor (ECF subfamily)